MSLNRFRLAQLFPVTGLITLLAFTGCVSSTVLQSRPTGAHVFLNNVPVGTTPYTMSDQNIVGTTTQVRLEYPGYQPLNTYIVRSEEPDVLAIIGGCFLLVPFLWIMKYSPVHYYELQPEAGAPPAWPGPPPVDQGGYPPPQGGAQQPPPGSYAPGPAGYPPPPPGYPPPAGQQPMPPAGQPAPQQ
jgi:hypothetical protein